MEKEILLLVQMVCRIFCCQINYKRIYCSQHHHFGQTIYTHQLVLMTPVGSHSNSSLLFALKGIVRHFVSNSYNVMTALICHVAFRLLMWRFLSHCIDIFVCYYLFFLMCLLLCLLLFTFLFSLLWCRILISVVDYSSHSFQTYN
jgi:hypothetical protein